MTSAAWFVVLATAGAIAEFGGVTLIALDIRDSRRQAKHILHRNITVYPASVRTTSTVSSPTLSTGPQTTEQRLDAVERKITTLDEQTTKRLAEMRQEMREVAEDAANRARAAA
ncbi:MAG TPA: hypothetical protein VFA45_02380 [Actinomycetes bacterium]|jgi:hypothetical protein|nr:hypothetical protein [Actinomycetes bacterium]